jgi:hypothetical protein
MTDKYGVLVPGNMSIWNAVSKTDPKHVKKVTFGRSFSAIDPHSQIKKATEQFGPVGQGWGYDCEHDTIQIDEHTLFATCDVWIWWAVSSGNGGIPKQNRFGPLRGASELRYVTSKGKTMIDTDAPKKAMTDALTKGLSHIGFNADVFLGLFDDSKYVQKRKEEEEKTSKSDTDQDWADQCIAKMVQAEDLNRLSEMWAKLQPHLDGRASRAIASLENSFTKLKRKFDEDSND